MHSRRSQRGYTLVEIMVAVIAIGIFTTMAVPSWVKTRDASRTNDAAARLEMIAAAVRQLTRDTGCFPGGLDLGGENRNPEIWDPAPAGDLWFVLVGDDGAGTESAWGQGFFGERNGLVASGACGSSAKDVTATCP